MQIVGTGIRSRLIKLLPQHLANSVALALGADGILVDWVARGAVRTNWGDALAPWLVQRISGRRVINARYTLGLEHHVVYTTIGSMLGTVDYPRLHVWGSGFVKDGPLRCKPKKVHAVRGPLSRAILLRAGVDCPEVYGDPALLMPAFHTPRSAEKRYRAGIIPHYRDYGVLLPSAVAADPDVLTINVGSETREFIDQLASCAIIASNSLHGLVAADAYGIPAVWWRMSDSPYGGGFKFRDYFGATRSEHEELSGTTDVTLERIERIAAGRKPDLNLDPFIRSCPFVSRSAIDRFHLPAPWQPPEAASPN